jgi:hypothetical protein
MRSSLLCLHTSHKKYGQCIHPTSIQILLIGTFFYLVEVNCIFHKLSETLSMPNFEHICSKWVVNSFFLYFWRTFKCSYKFYIVKGLNGKVLSSVFFWAIYRSKAIQREISKIDSQFQNGWNHSNAPKSWDGIATFLDECT